MRLEKEGWTVFIPEAMSVSRGGKRSLECSHAEELRAGVCNAASLAQREHAVNSGFEVFHHY